MEWGKTNKGKDKLFYEGYAYVFHRDCVSENFIRWRCCNHKKCPGSLTTDLCRKQVLKTWRHNHPKDKNLRKVSKAVEDMKNAARTTTKNPSQIFAEIVYNLPDKLRGRVPLEQTAKRSIRNQRSKDFPIEPRSIRNLKIEGEWTRIGGAEDARFLLHDNGIDASERIIIFSPDEGLRSLSTANDWFMDGNFALAPSLFSQLYVIRVPLGSSCITAVYCLLQRKTRETYEELFKILLEECVVREFFLDPHSIHMDFEKGAIEAAKTVFGSHITIKGCFYHLAQSTHRKIQQLGLESRYREDDDFSKFCGMLDGLAFLPVEDVKRGMEFLRENSVEGTEDLLDYFDSTYVSGTYRPFRRNNRSTSISLRNIPPVFPPETWSVRQSTMNGEDRTNNKTEGWNNRFKYLVGHKHPNIWTLIMKMRQEASVDKTKIEQRNLGVVSKKKKRTTYEVMQRRLKDLCMQHESGEKTMDEFLCSIGQTIRFRCE